MTALFRREATHPYTEAQISRSGGVWRLPQGPGHDEREPGAAHRLVARLSASLHEFFHRQHVMSELERLSDHELADIGLSRGDIPHVFEPDFAVKHAEEFGHRV